MRISGGISDLYGAESYARQGTKVQSAPAEQARKIDKTQTPEKKVAGTISLRGVLSARELKTLEAFFGDPHTNRQSLYGGRGAPKNIHSGMLLDVKG